LSWRNFPRNRTDLDGYAKSPGSMAGPVRSVSRVLVSVYDYEVCSQFATTLNSIGKILHFSSGSTPDIGTAREIGRGFHKPAIH
jgi:hypothetical protein